ncbi:hypothetical protein K488DRAFT_84527 [Vararia minispora EC-137]|uniref:Uncharacterized protein n=1 Tax=Vararia minispora EC-137 TaxID=1314806 RepID=A0ACB8QPT8_9AGAM|nr:hypothetical protein K488DRAFT_84527 [Vararia minispora EC-137]
MHLSTYPSSSPGSPPDLISTRRLMTASGSAPGASLADVPRPAAQPPTLSITPSSKLIGSLSRRSLSYTEATHSGFPCASAHQSLPAPCAVSLRHRHASPTSFDGGSSGRAGSDLMSRSPAPAPSPSARASRTSAHISRFRAPAHHPTRPGRPRAPHTAPLGTVHPGRHRGSARPPRSPVRPPDAGALRRQPDNPPGAPAARRDQARGHACRGDG